jgi:hypothetical protein
MSQIYDILDAVKTRLEAITGAPTVVVRKRLILLETDTLPVIVLAPAESSQTIRFRVFGKAAYQYNIGVALVEAGNRQFVAGTEDSLDLQQAIRDALTGVLLSGTDVWDTDISTNEAVMMPVDGNAQNYQISTFIATYSTLEDVTRI